MEEKVPIGPFIYFGTFPIPLESLQLTNEQMEVLKGLRPIENLPAPKELDSPFPEDMWLMPDEED